MTALLRPDGVRQLQDHGSQHQTGTGEPGRRAAAWRRLDTTTLLTLFLALQFLIPARLVLNGLGGAGRPSNLIGLGLLLLVAAAALQSSPRSARRSRRPVRWMVGTYAVVQLITYAVGVDRGLPGIESRSADRWMLLVLGLVGVALAVSEGVPRGRLDVLLRRLTYFSGAMGAVGLVQGLTGFNPVVYVTLPGLTLNANIIGISSRGGLPRVAGTAAHFIELGVVSAMVLPVALHFLFQATSGRQRAVAGLVTGLHLGGIAFSLSRSAVLALGVGMVVLFLGWSWRRRINVALWSVLVAVGAVVVSGRWLETMLKLFTGAGEDPSIQSRLEDYPVTLEYVQERPWLGRGAGTFLPDEYVLLDNQYLGILASSGIVGLLSLLLLLLGPIWVCLWIRRHTRDQGDRHLALALAATLTVAFVTSATFDSLSFTTFAGVLFMLIGSVGALHRATVRSPDGAPVQAVPTTPTGVSR